MFSGSGVLWSKDAKIKGKCATAQLLILQKFLITYDMYLKELLFSYCNLSHKQTPTFLVPCPFIESIILLFPLAFELLLIQVLNNHSV